MSSQISALTDKNLIPHHWNLLSDIEKMEYKRLQLTVSASTNRNRRNKSAETFNEMLKSIKDYVMRDDGNDCRRALVCGLFWVTCFIVVNTKQICILTGRSKSSINSSFQALGYQSPPNGIDSTNIVINSFDTFKNDYNELRQWTVRVLSSSIKSQDLIPFKTLNRPVLHSPIPDSSSPIVEPNIISSDIGTSNEFNSFSIMDSISYMPDDPYKGVSTFDIISNPLNLISPQEIFNDNKFNDNFDFF